MFSANVTVTGVNFNQSNSALNITITKNQTNYIQAIISKTSLPNISTLKIYINNNQSTFIYADNGNTWAITIITT